MSSKFNEEMLSRQGLRLRLNGRKTIHLMVPLNLVLINVELPGIAMAKDSKE